MYICLFCVHICMSHGGISLIIHRTEKVYYFTTAFNFIQINYFIPYIFLFNHSQE